ncbi:MAG: serine/threonine protein kinase, partial [Methylococcaceae bacterium]|nr:serine/threonine protein kinase [Methylococcaceae bacterium]
MSDQRGHSGFVDESRRCLPLPGQGFGPQSGRGRRIRVGAAGLDSGRAISDHGRNSMSTAGSLDGFEDYTIVNPNLYQRPPQADGESAGNYTEHYTLRGTVGVGGVGRVLLAFDERIGREVAIKEMLDAGNEADAGFRARFLREARITGRLEHPGIVPVYDVGTSRRGSPYYVMRFVRGDTLARALADCNRETPEQALAQRLQLLDRLIDVCEAMAYAHSKGVIHRDLKPGNIVLGPFGETIILDWGLAKAAGEAEAAPAKNSNRPDSADEGLTQMGDVLGTPAYMAPEQVDASFGQVDVRTDVFALGCILYVLLVGRPPLQGSSREILERLRSGAALPSSGNGGVAAPRELTAICDKALSVNPAERYRDAGELAVELCAFRDGRLVATYAYSRRELLRRFVSRNRLPIIAGAVVLLAILAGAGLAFQFAVEAERARNLAQAESLLARQAQRKAETTLSEVSRIANSNLAVAHQVETSLLSAVGSVRADLEAMAGLRPPLADRASMTPLLQG